MSDDVDDEGGMGDDDDDEGGMGDDDETKERRKQNDVRGIHTMQTSIVIPFRDERARKRRKEEKRQQAAARGAGGGDRGSATNTFRELFRTTILLY